jgi:two-component system sensor histidine kinase DesK
MVMRVQESSDGCTLTIEDDGRGAVLAQGSGLRGMRERVVAAGGALEFDTSSGTRLTVILPNHAAIVLGPLPLRTGAQRAG